MFKYKLQESIKVCGGSGQPYESVCADLSDLYQISLCHHIDNNFYNPVFKPLQIDIYDNIDQNAG